MKQYKCSILFTYYAKNKKEANSIACNFAAEAESNAKYDNYGGNIEYTIKLPKEIIKKKNK